MHPLRAVAVACLSCAFGLAGPEHMTNVLTGATHVLGDTALAIEAQVDSAEPDVIVPEPQRYEAITKFTKEGVLLGAGYNTYTKEILGDCVGKWYIPPAGFVSTSTYEMKLLRSLDEFKQETAVEARLDTSFGAFQASLSSKYSESSSSSSSRTYLMVRKKVILSPGLVLAAKEKSLLQPLTDQSPQSMSDFFAQCGNAYISEVIRGGEFVALLTAQESSNQLATELQIQADASYATTSAQAKFESTMQRMRQEASLEVSMYRMGGKTEVPAFQTGAQGVDILLKYAAGFASEVVDGNAVPIGLKTSGYPQLVRGFHINDYAAGHYSLIARKLDDVNRVLTRLDLDIKAYDTFRIPNTSASGRDKEARRQVAAQIEPLVGWMDRCGASFWDEAACKDGARLAAMTVMTPKPVVLLQLNPREPQPAMFSPSERMQMVVRGRYCWEGDGRCSAGFDGVTPGDQGLAYINVRTKSEQGAIDVRYVGDPLVVGPGMTVAVVCKDTDYSDNFYPPDGLYAIFYTP